ncbi:MAG: hypothetical protein H4O13_02760 [Xanthomonadales bacterium]|nr:hypothetical protein [Xanthomonadales bacterium]
MRRLLTPFLATALLMLGSLSLAVAQVSLDPSFVSQGRETVSFDLDTAATDRALRVFPTVGGGFLLVGQASNGSGQYSLALTRLFPVGLDPSFGIDGRRTYGLGLSQVADIDQDSQGRLLVAWQAFNGGNGIDVFVVRLNADGSRDASFGTGKGVTSFGLDAIDELLSLATGPNDEVYALVRSRPNTGSAWTTRIAALNADGLGLRSTFIDFMPEQGSGAIAWSSGRGALLVAQTSDGGGFCGLSLSQVRSRLVNGVPTLIVTALTGLTLTGLSSSCAEARITAVAAIPDSEGALVAGHREDPASPGSGRQHGLLLRWAGVEDSNFGTVAPLPPADDLRFSAVAVDTRGRILTAGTARNSAASTQRFSLRRHLVNLGGDTGFNAGSPEITTSFVASNGLDSPLASAADLRVVGTRLLVAGSVRFAGPSDDDFAVAAFTTPDAAPIFRDGFEN